MTEKNGATFQDKELLQELGDEAKRLIVDSLYSGRGHLEESEYWARWETWLGLPTTVLSTVLAAGAGVSALIDQVSWLTATLALMAAALNGARAFVQAREKADTHGRKGNRYIALRNEARFFLKVDLNTDATGGELVARMRDLRERYDKLKETAPLTIPRRAYEAAKRGIEAGEASYENDPVWKELGG